MAAAVETHRIEAAFAGALGDFSLDVAFEAPMRGIAALFGASGCGKSTTLRCIAGLQRLPGRLVVGGEVWQDDDAGVFLKPHRRPIGVVFQDASLFSHLSVHGNLLYGARRAERSGVPPVIRSRDVIELLGLERLLDRAPDALSGGERQRVAVGRALLSQPRLLLMDEPLSSLDRMAKDEILPYFEALHEELSIPILYVSHDIAEVARLADWTVILSSGRKLAEGPVRELLERLDLWPETGRFEAGVLLTARVTGHDERYGMTYLDHHGQTISMPARNLAVGAEVRLRVRARDVSLATRRPEAISVRNVLSGTVVEIAEDSDTAYAETLIDIGGGRLRACVTRQSVADLRLAPGTSVYALVKSIVFDRGTLSIAATAPAGAGGGRSASPENGGGR